MSKNGGHVPWGSLDPERRAEAQRNHRRRHKLRQMGKPASVDPAPSMRRVRRLHDECGMTFREIATAAGPGPTGKTMAQSSVGDLYRGYRRDPAKPIKRIPRTTQDRIMSVPWQPPSAGTTAWMDATGTRRRLQALAAVGYGCKFQARYLGHVQHQSLWRLMTGTKADSHSRSKFEKVSVATREAVKEMYSKLHLADPKDHGLVQGDITRTKNAAAKRGFVPPACWDDDTIDNPDAFPEHTGRCGTVAGYFLHLKYGILVERTDAGGPHKRQRVLCTPCREARTAEVMEGRGTKHDWGAIYDAYRQCEESPWGRQYGDLKKIAEEFKVSERTVARIVEKMKKAETDEAESEAE